MPKSSSSSFAGSEPRGATSQASYVDLDTLRAADGMVGIISQRRSTGVLTFAVFKEFERDGITERTSFVPEHMIASYQDMVDKVVERIAELRRKADAMAGGGNGTRGPRR